MKNIDIINDLKKNGRGLHISHYRNVRINGRVTQTLNTPAINAFRESGYNVEILPRGGFTVINYDTGKNLNLSAVARCNEVDGFNKRDGVSRGLVKILKAAISNPKFGDANIQFDSEKWLTFLSQFDKKEA